MLITFKNQYSALIVKEILVALKVNKTFFAVDDNANETIVKKRLAPNFFIFHWDNDFTFFVDNAQRLFSLGNLSTD
jgi:hypothetical protein